MIRILATALLALSLTASGAFATSIGDLVARGGLYYKKFTVEPYTGAVDEGLSRGAFKDGKRDGPWVQYHDNDRVESKGAFKDGKRDGPWVAYYENGGTEYNARVYGRERSRVLGLVPLQRSAR